MFDVTEHLDQLRRRETGWLVARRVELVCEQRRLRVEELAVTRVLDERGALDAALAARDGVSERTVRETVETARALESLPEIAAAAYAGDLSAEQLGSVAQLADEASDGEWARRAPHVAPVDLARMVRTQRTPTMDEARARRAARGLRMWWQADRGMLSFRGELADLDGSRFENTINRMIDRMRPPKGEPWDSREHRGADALVELCERFADVESPVNSGRGRCSWSTSPAKVPPKSPGSRSPTRWSKPCVPTQRSNRSWSTTTARGSRSGRAGTRCHPRSCGRCCCVICIVGSGPANAATASRSTT